MKPILVLALIPIVLEALAQTPEPLQTPSSGRIDRVENFYSMYVAARNVDIWLPEGYDGKKKYAVLYMHDGQMLFDPTNTWNKTSWEVDDVLAGLMGKRAIKDVIVVGVWNIRKNRYFDYFPKKPFDSLGPGAQQLVFDASKTHGVGEYDELKIRSDEYLKFLVMELKPYIDHTYSTLPDRKHTFIAGSSMGGLISMYAMCEYPEVYGGAACISTHWPGIFTLENNPIPAAFCDYLAAHLPDPKTHKFYFDHGTATLDALYPQLQQKVDEVMKAKGYSKKNWKTLAVEGAEHNEIAWNKRLDVPMRFLLGR